MFIIIEYCICQLVEMGGKGVDLSLDWISRTLYMVTENGGEHTTNSIMGYHMEQALYTQIVSRINITIGSVISDPYARYVSSFVFVCVRVFVFVLFFIYNNASLCLLVSGLYRSNSCKHLS
jgi:hypothetical protein